MKYITLLAVLLLNLNSYGQIHQENPDAQLFYQKYKSSKKTANILLITGGTAITSGILLASIKTENAGCSPLSTIGGVLLIFSGTITSGVSVPFYLTAYNNKRKYLKLKPLITNQKIDNKNYTAIDIAANF